MTSLRPDANEELARKINELLVEGAKVIVHEREAKDGILHCLIFQHGSRRHVVEEKQPFTDSDIPMIVGAVERWVAGRHRPRGAAWVEDPNDADRAVVIG